MQNGPQPQLSKQKVDSRVEVTSIWVLVKGNLGSLWGGWRAWNAVLSMTKAALSRDNRKEGGQTMWDSVRHELLARRVWDVSQLSHLDLGALMILLGAAGLQQ